jgi:hypothetical protein
MLSSLKSAESGSSKGEVGATEGLNVGLLAGIAIIVVSGFVLIGVTGAILVFGGTAGRRLV